MDEKIRFEMARDQALTVLGAVELQRDDLEARLKAPDLDHTERDTMEVASTQFAEAAQLLRLALFG